MATDEASLVWCGPDPVPRNLGNEFGRVIQLSSFPNNKNVKLKIENICSKLAQDLEPIAVDLLEVASYVYCADQAVTRGGKTWPQNGKRWVRRFKFNIPVRCPEIWKNESVTDCLQDTLGFLSDDHYNFEFRSLDKDIPRDTYFDFDEGKPWFKADSVLLFSGGLDSLTGAVSELSHSNRKVALVSHRPAPQIYSRQKQLVNRLASTPKDRSRILHVPVWVNKEPGLTKDANQRSRSFLYLALGAAVARMLGVDSLKFYENGIVSVNLPISGQVVGGRASRSTHPKVLNRFQKFLSLLYQTNFSVENPFLWKTKSDVVSSLIELDGQELIPLSCSCSHTRRITKVHTHCGVCSQCIERRIATIFNGVEKNDPAYSYGTDLFTGSLNEKLDRSMVISYIEHASILEQAKGGEFFERFPEALRILDYIGMLTSKAAQALFDLHQRHGKQVGEVLEKQIRLHAHEIRTGNLQGNSLLSTFVGDGADGKRKPADGMKFPTPEGVDWSEVTLEIISNDSARVRVRDIVRVYTALDMGFRDKRKRDLPNRQWDTLMRFAHGSGALSWASPRAHPKMSKSVEYLGKSLKQFFGIYSSPFRRYSKRQGWVTRFTLKDYRGSM